MYKNKFILLPVIFLIAVAFVKTPAKSRTRGQESEVVVLHSQNGDQAINLFVTHGHCSTPFGGMVNRLQVTTRVRDDLGNPLEAMEILFEIDPNVHATLPNPPQSDTHL